MDRIMRLLDVYPMAKYSGLDTPIPEGKKQYYIREGHCGTFFPGRCCDIVVVDGEGERRGPLRRAASEGGEELRAALSGLCH